MPTDAAVELSALSGMPAYIARPYLDVLQGGERRWVAEERLAELEAIERETLPTFLEALAAYKNLRLDGLMSHFANADLADQETNDRQLAAFTQGKVAVYRITNR